jgi:hypothetical protein
VCRFGMFWSMKELSKRKSRGSLRDASERAL